MDPFDIYIVHAYEDKELAERLDSELTALGLSTWFNAFRPGYSIRRQMDDGLQSSTYGAVVVTENLFSKRWAMEELDALYALESSERPRIIPVWAGVTFEQVLLRSPILSSRYAINHIAPAETAHQLAAVVLDHTYASSPGQWLRAVVAGGFRWTTGPVWLRQSLVEYDHRASEFVDPLIHRLLPEGAPPSEQPQQRTARPVPLAELLRATPLYDGQEIALIGHQNPHGRQVFTKHMDLPPEHRAESVVSYVFQLRSAQLPSSEFAYVHVVGPYSPGWGPWSREGELCWVTGFPVAYGAVPMSDGRVGQCVYVTARIILFTPQAGKPEEDAR